MENDLLVQPIKIITKFDITIMIQQDPTKQIALPPEPAIIRELQSTLPTFHVALNKHYLTISSITLYK
jgi:hypothetical protein